jgi:hypothetical protein
MHYIRAVCLSFMGGMLLCASIATTPATAALVTFNFTCTVSNVGNKLSTNPATFSSGQAVSGSYTFNSATGDSIPGANTGLYNNTISNLVVHIGSYTATLGAGVNFIEVENKNNVDRYTLQAPVTGDPVNGRLPKFFEIKLTDSSHTAFSNDHQPTSAPSLSSFSTETFRLVFNGQGAATVSGVLTSLTAVPLPAAVILFGAGLVALVGLGAGSWRQKKHSLA